LTTNLYFYQKEVCASEPVAVARRRTHYFGANKPIRPRLSKPISSVPRISWEICG